eukprot:6468577-Amphidinium_carterae.1
MQKATCQVRQADSATGQPPKIQHEGATLNPYYCLNMRKAMLLQNRWTDDGGSWCCSLLHHYDHIVMLVTSSKQPNPKPTQTLNTVQGPCCKIQAASYFCGVLADWWLFIDMVASVMIINRLGAMLSARLIHFGPKLRCQSTFGAADWKQKDCSVVISHS